MNIHKYCTIKLEYFETLEDKEPFKMKNLEHYKKDFFELLCSYEDINHRESFYIVINV